MDGVREARDQLSHRLSSVVGVHIRRAVGWASKWEIVECSKREPRVSIQVFGTRLISSCTKALAIRYSETRS